MGPPYPSQGIYAKGPAGGLTRLEASRVCPALTRSHWLWVPWSLLLCGHGSGATSHVPALLRLLQPTARFCRCSLRPAAPKCWARQWHVGAVCFCGAAHPRVPFTFLPAPSPSPCPPASRAGRCMSRVPRHGPLMDLQLLSLSASLVEQVF